MYIDYCMVWMLGGKVIWEIWCFIYPEGLRQYYICKVAKYT